MRRTTPHGPTHAANDATRHHGVGKASGGASRGAAEQKQTVPSHAARQPASRGRPTTTISVRDSVTLA